MLCYKAKAFGGKWDKEMVSGMQGTPQQPNPIKVGLRIPVRLSTDDNPTEETPQAQPETVEGEVPPMPEAIPDPLVRRTPITYKEVESMDQHQAVLDARQRQEVK